jgi:hypothetical protein
MNKAQRARYGAAQDYGILEPFKKPEGSTGVSPPPLCALLNAIPRERAIRHHRWKLRGGTGGCTIPSFICPVFLISPTDKRNSAEPELLSLLYMIAEK